MASAWIRRNHNPIKYNQPVAHMAIESYCTTKVALYALPHGRMYACTILQCALPHACLIRACFMWSPTYMHCAAGRGVLNLELATHCAAPCTVVQQPVVRRCVAWHGTRVTGPRAASVAALRRHQQWRDTMVWTLECPAD
jgi:hypothetical protein